MPGRDDEADEDDVSQGPCVDVLMMDPNPNMYS